jgi:hypothetical protein
MDQKNDGSPGEEGEKEGDLVEVFHDDVKSPLPPGLLEMTWSMESKGEPSPHSVEGNPIHHIPRRSPWKTRCEEGDVMALGDQPSEDFMEVDLCPSGLRIQPVLPVDHEDPQLRRPPTGLNGALQGFFADS